MTDDLASLLRYNRWADARLLDACRAVAADRYGAEVLPGWPSLRSTIAHIAGGTDIWARRLLGRPADTFLLESDLPTPDAAAAVLESAHAGIELLVAGATPEQLAATLTYRSIKGDDDKLSIPVWAAIRHVVNHETYHRGQAASKLKRLGVEPPPTDFSAWIWAMDGSTEA